MVMWKLNSLVGRCRDKGFVEEVRYRDISEATGVSQTTLARIMSGNSQRIDQGTVDRLLNYFSDLLNEELSISDLLEWRRDKASAN